MVTLLDLCVSSLRRGHANLLCIVPILTDDPRRESKRLSPSQKPGRCAFGERAWGSGQALATPFAFPLQIAAVAPGPLPPPGLRRRPAPPRLAEHFAARGQAALSGATGFAKARGETSGRARAESVGALLLCRQAMVVKPCVAGHMLLVMWTVLLNQTSGLQGLCHVSGGFLAGNDPGTGSGWRQSRPNRTPLCSDKTVNPNVSAAPLVRYYGW